MADRISLDDIVPAGPSLDDLIPPADANVASAFGQARQTSDNLGSRLPEQVQADAVADYHALPGSSGPTLARRVKAVPGQIKNVAGQAAGALGAAAYDLSSGMYGIARGVVANLDDSPITDMIHAQGGRTLLDPVKDWLAEAQHSVKASGDAVAGPDPTSFVAKSLKDGVRSLPSSFAAIGFAAIGAPEVGLGLMSAQTGGQAMGDALDAGVGTKAATSYAVSQSVIEYATEKLPVMKYLEDTKLGSSFARKLFNNLTEEMIGEQAATAMQDFNDFAVLHPEQSIVDYVKARPAAAASTAIAVFVGSSVTMSLEHGGHKLLDAVRQAPSAPANEGTFDAPAPEPVKLPIVGDVEAATAQAAAPTPEDEASPIDTDLITAGRVTAAQGQAKQGADAKLAAAGLPKTGSRVRLDMGNGLTATGTMSDTFTHHDPDLGAQDGVRLTMDDGTTFEEFLSAIDRGGMKLTEMLDNPEASQATTASPAAPALDDLIPAAAGSLPVANGRITSPFGHRAAPTEGASTNHQGIDIAAPVGTSVRAMGPGKVLFARGDGANGNIVRIQHADGSVSSYAHLDGFSVKAGDEVAAGQLIGGVGTTGRTTGPHLHYAVKNKDGQFVDPATANLTAQAGGTTETAAADQEGSAAAEQVPSSTDAARKMIEEASAEVSTPAPQTSAENEPETAPEVTTPTATVEDRSTGKSIIVKGATDEQMAAIKAALPPAVMPLLNSREGGFVFSKKYEPQVREALNVEIPIDQRRAEMKIALPEGAGTRAAPVEVKTAADMAAVNANVVDGTDAQREAGNHAMGHARIAGMDVTIEIPKGGERRGTGPDGTKWSTKLDKAAYGYIKRSTGADGENFDVYVGDHPSSPDVFVVDQIDPKTGKFDEHKGIVGARNEAEARDIFESGFSDGSGAARIGGVKRMPVSKFREFVADEPKKPVADRSVAIVIDPAKGTTTTVPLGKRGESPDDRPLTDAENEAFVAKHRADMAAGEAAHDAGVKRALVPMEQIAGWERASRRAQQEGFSRLAKLREAEQRPKPASAADGSTESTTTERPAAEPAAGATSPKQRGFHGGTIGLTDEIRTPFFTATNASMAEGYANDRGRGKGRVIAFDIDAKKTATEADVKAAAEGIFSPTEISQGGVFGLVDAEFAGEKAGQLIAKLRGQGFDSIAYSDFPVGSEENTEPSMVVLDPSIISNRHYADEQAPAPTKPTYGTDNKLVTNDRAAVIREKLRAKMNQMNSGIDPEAMALGTELAVYHIEAGARRFVDFAKAITADLGITLQKARPFLRSWYNGARDMMEDHDIGVAGMDSPDQVRIEMAALFRQENNDGLQSPVRGSDARPSAEDVQRSPEDRGAEQAPGGQEPRGAPDAERGAGSDTGQREVAQRPTARPEASEGSGGERAVDADRLPTGEPGSQRNGRADTAAAAANRVTGQNWTIEPGSLEEGRGTAQKARDNVKAIEIIKALDVSGRPATREEQAALAKYVGWGGLKNAFNETNGEFPKGFEKIGPRIRELLSDEEYKQAARSTQYAHYTSEKVIRPMWDAVRRLGFAGGKVFEPGLGTGNFLGMMPADMAGKSQYAGIEYDRTTARIAQLLYPQSGIGHADYTRMPMPKDAYDLVIGNPPFSETVIKSDPEYSALGLLLHDYFFAKSLDAVRPGGLLMFVTSAGTMNKASTKAREYLAERADLVGAVRLPGNAFEENAGTSVTTDIVILRKRLPGEVVGDRDWIDAPNRELPDRDGGKTVGSVNAYFSSHPDMVLGVEGFFDKLVASNRYAVRARPGTNVSTELTKALATLPANVMSPWVEQAGRADFDLNSQERKEGSFYLADDGKLMQHRAGVGVPVQGRGKGVEGGIPAKDQEKIRDLVPIRDALREVYGHDLAGNSDRAETARKKLNKTYDAFVKKHGPINKAEITFRRPTVIQQESARNAAREETRLAGNFFDEGAFDPSDMIARKASTTEIARARAAEREAAQAFGREFDEGSFIPADMPDIVIDKRPNIDPFMDDQEGYRLRAIEHYNDDTGEAQKGNVFFENVITKEREPVIKGPGDALLYVLNKTGRVDLADIAARSNLSQDDVVEQLGSSIFEDPQGSWETREKYLSGNVRKKLDIARAAAERDPRYARNVAALEGAQPPDLAPAEISANLGMPWLPTDVIEEFGKSLGLNAIAVRYNGKIAQWAVTGDRASAASTATWGTSDRDAVMLISDALNRTDPKIYRSYTDANGNKKQEINVEATQAAQDKMREIKAKFADWVYSDPARADRLAGIYNRDFNNLVAPVYDGSYLSTPGIASTWSWRPHQTRVIARIIQSGNTYMAHAVGAGKTSAMIGAGMEMRRLGLVRKPMYVVPNHMLGQFTKEFYEQYPTARIAVADEKRFHTDRRKQFIANVAADDLDAVIITHSSFGFIPLSQEFTDNLITQQVEDYRALLGEVKAEGGDSRITQRRIEQSIEAMEQRLSGKQAGRKDQVFTFEEMGTDFLFVDEAHLFRKLDFATKMANVRGVDPSGSQAAYDLYAKTRYLEGRTPGRSHVLASGTPITNTMAELYSLSRYLQADALAERGIEQFDAWAGAFGDTVTALEQDAAGGYKPQTRFAKFVNVPELSAMVRQVMDVVTSKQLEQYVVRPKIKGGKREMVMAEAGPALDDFQDRLKARMKAIEKRKGPPQKGDDIMLSVIGDGRKAAIDMRLIDPTMNGDPDSKLEKLIDRVSRIADASKRQPFHKVVGEGYSEKPVDFGPATQMVFSDLGINGDFPVHTYIASELARRGIPRNQIAIISDYKSTVARQRLFNDMNEGKVRVLIGSVAKMGTGVNAQRRLLAVHNLDPQWYPANDEQRNGRILRQGNMNPEIEIVDYSTKGTYDSQMWGLMANKANFIEGFMLGDPTMRDIEDLGEASQYEQAKAITTSDPRVMQLTEMKQDLERAQRRKGAFEREQYAIRRRVNEAEDTVERYEKRIPEIEADIAQRQDIAGDAFTGTVMGKTFTDRAEFGEAVLARLDDLAKNRVDAKDAKVGEIAGFPMVASVYKIASEVRTDLSIQRNGDHQSSLTSGTALGISQSAARITAKFDEDLERARTQADRARNEVAEFTPKMGAAFTGQPEIDAMGARVRNLEGELEAETKRANAEPGSPEAKASRADDAPTTIETRDAGAVRAALTEQLRQAGIADRVAVDVADRLYVAEKTAQGGYWPQAALIRVALDSRQPVEEVMDHEIVHAMRHLGLFTDAEWSTLERAAVEDEVLMAQTRSRWIDLPRSEVTEEAVAEMYSRYMRDQRAVGDGPLAQLMERIRKFIEALRVALGGQRDAVADLLAAMASGEIGARTGTERADASVRRSDNAFADPDTEKRWQAAREGIADQTGIVERVKTWTQGISDGFTRHYKALPNAVEYSDLKQQLRKLEAASQSSKERVVRVLSRMVDGMNQGDYDLFSRKVILDDLAYEADEGRDLPFGFTPATIAGEKARIDIAATANAKVTNAIRQRKLINDSLAREMVAAGVLSEEQVKNPSYYRHQVLEYARLQQATARSSAAARLRAPRWARRQGSALDINANLLEAEFDWMHKAFTDIETAKTIDWIKRSDHNIRGDLIKQANDSNRQAVSEAEAKDQGVRDQAASFRQRIAIALSGLRSVIDDGTLDVPAHLQDAADAIVTGRRGGDAPFELISWILDNNMPGSVSAASILKAVSERREWTKALIGSRYVDPTDIKGLVKRLAPDGYTTWQPEEGKLLFTAKTIPEHVIDGMIAQLTSLPGVDGAVFAEILRNSKSALVVGGEKYQMVLPQEVADTLNSLRDPQVTSVIDEMVQAPLRAWKRWVLINPRRVIKYNLNNLSGDLDAVLAGNPKLLRRVGQAGKELWNVMRKGEAPSQTYQDAVDRGVFDSGLSVQEIPDINAFSAFAAVADAPSSRPDKVTARALGKVWRGLQGATQWRENVFRYAAYLDYLDRLQAGESMDTVGYGASVPAMVDAVADVKDRAALLARDLVGDYGDVSASGQALRKRLLPFYSWMEVNTRRYWRLSRNAYGQGLGKGIAVSGGLAIAAGARRSAWLALRMAMVYGMIQVWNHLLHPDEEKELSDEQQQQLHIILGTVDGKVVTMRTQGALSDALGWFGYDDAMAAYGEMEKGRASVLDVIKSVAKAPIQKVAGGLSPMITQPVEAATGKKLYPDLFNPRVNRDPWRNFFSTFSMENEYDAIKGKPTRGYLRSWLDVGTYARDPGEIAYDTSRGLAFEWNKRVKGQEGGFSSTKRGDALYDYRKALRYGDEAAADKALATMAELGMDRGDLEGSLKRAAPLGPIAKKDRKAFIASLTDEEFTKLQRAQAWYEQTFR